MAMGVTEIRFQKCLVLPQSVAVSARAFLQRCRRAVRAESAWAQRTRRRFDYGGLELAKPSSLSFWFKELNLAATIGIGWHREQRSGQFRVCSKYYKQGERRGASLGDEKMKQAAS
eukprot:6202379-Pleurochrysis_carterae.AAC.1